MMGVRVLSRTIPKNMDDDGVRVALPGSTLETRIGGPVTRAKTRSTDSLVPKEVNELLKRHISTEPIPTPVSYQSRPLCFLLSFFKKGEINGGRVDFQWNFPSCLFDISVFLFSVGIFFYRFYPRVPSGIGARRGGRVAGVATGRLSVVNVTSLCVYTASLLIKTHHGRLFTAM